MTAEFKIGDKVEVIGKSADHCAPCKGSESISLQIGNIITIINVQETDRGDFRCYYETKDGEPDFIFSEYIRKIKNKITIRKKQRQ